MGSMPLQLRSDLRRRVIGWMLLWIVLCGPQMAAATAVYGSVSDAEFQRLLTTYRDDPTYLARHVDDVLRGLSTSQVSAAIEQLGFDHFTYQNPVIIKGRDVPELLGHACNDIVMMAVRGGKLIPIPTQVDDLDTRGWVYIPEKDPNPVDGTLGKLDPVDEIVFMYRDTGEVRYDPAQHGAVSGRIVKELSFEDQAHRQRYAYLVAGAKQRSAADYVSFDIQTGKFYSTYWDFQINPKSFLNFEKMYAHVGPEQQHMVFDSFWGEISTGVFTNFPRFTFNVRDNMDMEAAGVRDGPVRVAILGRARAKAMGIHAFSVYTQFYLYDQRISVPVQVKIPGGEILTRIFYKPELRIALKFNDLKGAHVSAAFSPKPDQYAVVDGHMSDFEKAIVASKTAMTSQNNWIWMDSERGWNVFARFQFPPGWPEQLQVLYQDDATAKRESWMRFAGLGPTIGIIGQGFPVGKLDITVKVDIWLLDTVGKQGPAEFAQIVDKPPALKLLAYVPKAPHLACVETAC